MKIVTLSWRVGKYVTEWVQPPRGWPSCEACHYQKNSYSSKFISVIILTTYEKCVWPSSFSYFSAPVDVSHVITIVSQSVIKVRLLGETFWYVVRIRVKYTKSKSEIVILPNRKVCWLVCSDNVDPTTSDVTAAVETICQSVGGHV